MTIRRRLLVATMTSLGVGLVALIVVGNVVLSVRADADTAAALRARAQAQLAALQVRDGRVTVREAPNDSTLDRDAWVFADGAALEAATAVPADLAPVARALAGSRRAVTRAGPGGWVLYAEPIAGARRATVVVARSTAQVERLERRVLIGSVVLGAVLLAGAALAIRVALAAALRPVSDLTRAADDWSEHDLDRRFAVDGPADELTALADTLDRLLDRIARSRRHEQRLTVEIAHELRTPLARMRGRAELALNEPDATRARAALAASIEDARALDHVVTTLLTAAREPGTAGDTADLAAVARRFEDVTVTVGAPPGPTAEGDPAIVERALAPLVDNARRHARGRVWIEVAEHDGTAQAVVCDDGPGVDPAVADRLFQAGVSGDGGAGLGLALAVRLAEGCGGTVARLDGPGGRFALRLPAVRFSQGARPHDAGDDHHDVPPRRR